MLPRWKEDHLKRFATLRTSNRLARDIGESVSVVNEYLELNNLDNCSDEYKNAPHTYVTDKIKRFKPVEPVKRFPAVYDNKSWEDNINEILSK